MRRFEYDDAANGGSSKFWELDMAGKAFTVRWGRLGTGGQSQTKTFTSEEQATRAAEKLVREKLAKGYSEVPASRGNRLARKVASKTARPAVKAPRKAAKKAPKKTPKQETPAARLRRLLSEIRQLSRKLGRGEKLVRIYALAPSETKAGPGTINRLGGDPIGVDLKRWPRFKGGFKYAEPDEDEMNQDGRMEHLLTLDLADVPELRERREFRDARALSLFISSASSNEAWEPNSGHTALVLSKEKDVARGVLAQHPLEPRPGRTFTLIPLDVPAGAFPEAANRIRSEEDISDEEFESGRRFEALRRLGDTLRRLPGRVLGEPLWLQGEQDQRSPFVLQFDERLVPVNLGDVGIMYVFRNTAFWQCH